MPKQIIDEKGIPVTRFLTKNNDVDSKPVREHKIGVICHIHYPDLFEEIVEYLQILEDDFDIYLSLSQDNLELVPIVFNKYPNAYIFISENVGRDLNPFLVILKEIFPMGYQAILKLHTKKSPHRSDGDSWRHDMFAKLLGSKENVEQIRKRLKRGPKVGIIGPKGHVISYRAYCGASRDRVNKLAEAVGIAYSEDYDFPFVAGTMFWANPKALEGLTRLPEEILNYEKEPVVIDGALAHALERFIGLLVNWNGYDILESKGLGVLSNPDLTQSYAYTPPSKQLNLRDIHSVILFSHYDERFAIEHLRITAPYKQAGIDVLQGISEGEIQYERISQVDAVVFQREFPRDLAAYGRVLKAAGELSKPIIYDLDDLLFDLPEKHPERLSMDYSNALLPMLNALMHADHVIVATEKLKETLQEFNENISVLPNYLDDNLWEFNPPRRTKETDSPITIGYMGSSSHKPDLEMIAPVLVELLEEYGEKLNFHVWGTEVPEILQGKSQVIWTPSPTNNYSEFGQYFQKQEADIFIAPLEDNLFNHCKSGIKFLEYSALGVPGVFSKLDGYAEMITQGQDGYLANSLEDWRDCLVKLIEGPALRERIARKAQETVRSKWLLTKNIDSWQSIIDTGKLGFNSKTNAKTGAMNLINAISSQLYLLQITRDALAKDLSERNAELTTKVYATATELEEERTTLKKGHLALEKLEASYRAKTEEFDVLNQRTIELTGEIKTLGQKHDQLSSFSEELKIENQCIKNQIETATQVVNTLKNTLEHRERTIKNLNEQNEVLRVQREKNVLEISDLKKLIDHQESSIQTLNQRLEENNQEQKRLSEIIDERTYQNQIVNNELREKVNELGAIKVSRAWKVAVFLRKVRAKVAPVDGWVSRTLSRIKGFIMRSARSIKRRIGLWLDMALLRRSELFDKEWYLANNPDLKDAGVNPVKHFMYYGGFEGRDPSPNFSSSQYLASYVDVKESGTNPLVHYLRFGEKEGRERRDSLIQTPDQIILPGKVLTAKKLLSKISKAMICKEYVLSFSHDNYLSIVGGVQLRITDEQNFYLKDGVGYLHVYPYIRRSSLVHKGEPFFIGVNCDGVELGIVDPESLTIALKHIKSSRLKEVHIHHTLGFDLLYLRKLLSSLGIKKAQFWLHDFFSICPGYFLLRNDKQFCGAPSIESNACTICKYGKNRSKQNKEFVSLFNDIDMEVIAPSQFAIEIWGRSFASSEYTSKVIPHLKLAWKEKRPSRTKKEKINVGFIGYPVEHKGWGAWKRLTKEFSGDPRYKFFYFSNDWGGHGNFEQVLVTVSRETRLAMQETIIENEVDVAVLWSLCPETFSFTLYESLAAGCLIITNKDSGNIQDYIARNPEHGLVLRNENELKELFDRGRLAKLVRSYQEEGIPMAELIFPDEVE